MYTVRILGEAAEEIARLDRAVASRIARKVAWLAENIDQMRPERLRGDLGDLLKLRVGDYRVLYELLPDEQTLVIYKVGHRRDVYESP